MTQHRDSTEPTPALAPTPALEPAFLALRRYRERRALDGGGPSCLIERAQVVERHRVARRRAELVDRLVRETDLGRAFAERAYDIAREEGVEPAFALELVRCGVGIRETSAAAEGGTEDEPARMERPPEWLSAPPPAKAARRERRLRGSFRRLRGLLERHDDPADALVAFVHEPDVAADAY